MGHVDDELLHVPCPGRAALGAQAAVQAHVLILHQHPPRGQRAGYVEVLGQIQGRCLEAGAQVLFLSIDGERDAIGRADVDAGVAFDAQRRGEYRLDVAVETALGFGQSQGRVEAQFDLGLHIGQGLGGRELRHDLAIIVRNVIVVAPLVDAHFLR